jgi:predicted ArsR family transcriptional regulator
MSDSARQIFMTLVKSPETQLTTLDMQSALEARGVKLGKKELNNWLSSLQAAGLVQKEPERGKPTTTPYNGRYTYDLWSLTEKGLETMQKLSIFSHETPTLNNVKTIVERRLPSLEEATVEQLNQLEALYTTYRTLKALRSQVRPVTLGELSATTSINREALKKWLENQEKTSKEPLFELHRKSPGIVDRIVESLGFNRGAGLLVSLSFEGRRRASALP